MDETVWRKATEEEKKEILDWGIKIKEDRDSLVIFLIVVIDISLILIGSLILYASHLVFETIAFVLFMLILGGAIAVSYLYHLNNKIKLIVDGNIRVADAYVDDKEKEIYNSNELYYLVVRFNDGSQKRMKITDEEYGLATLSSKVLIIEYNDGNTSGFYGDYDIRVVRDFVMEE